MDKKVFDTAVEELLSEARSLIPEELFPDQPYVSGTDTGWYSFELKLWSKGEELRQLLTASGRRLTAEQAAAVLSICLEPKAKRGRQSFLLLLGRTCFACHAQAVAGLLSDPHVAGQAIDTLCKMRVPGFSGDIEPFLSHEKTWVRNCAKRYLAKYQ